MRRVPHRPEVPGTPARCRVVDRLQKSVINPLDKVAFALGIPPPGDALLETTGRSTGLPRITPVCDGTEGDTFWIVAQHGHAADYVRNIEADPRGQGQGQLVAHLVADRNGAHPRRRRFPGTRTDPRSWQSLASGLPASLDRGRNQPRDGAHRPRSPLTRLCAADRPRPCRHGDQRTDSSPVHCMPALLHDWKAGWLLGDAPPAPSVTRLLDRHLTRPA